MVKRWRLCDATRMAACTVIERQESALRVLCLGNELLADDAFGGAVAKEVQREAPGSVDVVFTANTGLSLLEHMLNTRRLVVVDTVLTGRVEPGTVLVVKEEDVQAPSGNSPHYVGLFEALALARKLRLPAPEEVTIIAVEAADCTTVGGAMTPAVKGAVPAVLALVSEIITESLSRV